MTLFRIYRDEAYLRKMLGMVRRFYKTYVQPRRTPPKDMFFNQRDHQASALSRSIQRHATLFVGCAKP